MLEAQSKSQGFLLKTSLVSRGSFLDNDREVCGGLPMKAFWRESPGRRIISFVEDLPHCAPIFVFNLFICFLLSLFLIAGSALAASIPRTSTVSLDDPLLKSHGGAAATSVGDYVSSSGALNGPYRFYVEVPAGTTRLVVDIFDADVGMGGTGEATPGRDRSTSGTWTTTSYYRLFDPSGTEVTTNFSQGNSTGPANSDNAWLTLYDSDSPLPLAPQFVAVQTNATGTTGTNSLTIDVPAGNVGDLLLLVVSKDGNSAIGIPTGWTLVNRGACAGGGGGACYLGVFQRTATGAETSVTVTWTGGGEASAGGILRYSGVDPVSPINVSGASTGGSSTPTAPSVTTTVGSTRVVRMMGADRHRLSANPYPGGNTGRFAIPDGGTDGNGTSAAAADTSQTLAGPTGTAAFSLTSNQNWRAVTVALRPSASSPSPLQAGHWLLEVDTSGAGNGDNINAFGIRAHDGDPGSGGTEIPIYAQPYIPLGVNGPDPMSNTFTMYPYVTGGCTVDFSEFDMDAGNTGDQGQLTANARGGGQVINVDDAQMSGNNVWLSHQTSSIDTNPLQNTDHGIWPGSYRIGTYPGNANYTVLYSDNYPTTLPPSSLTVPSYRLYFPVDGGSAPVKPYLEQQLTYVSGPQAPTEGETTIIQITVRIVNPTASNITFGGSNLVSATIPDQTANGATVVLYGGLDATPGTTIVSYPGIGNPGLITWDPGIVGSNETKILTYQIEVTPNNGGLDYQTIFVTGQPGNSDGTQATFLDETGNAAQARATYTFGPLCGLSVTEGTSITHVSLSSFRAYADGGRVRVEWETSGEAGTVGFVLTRLNGHSGRYDPVHSGRIRALMTGAEGGIYSVIDPGAVPGGRYNYQLIEIQSNGGRRRYGPFEVSVDGSPADLGIVSNRHGADAASTELLGSSLAEPRGSIREPRKTLEEPPLEVQQAYEVSQSHLARDRKQKVGSVGKLVITEDGLYKLTASQIANALGRPERGICTSISTGKLQITNRGSPVQYLPADQGEALYFYGEAIHSPYTRENVYWVAQARGTVESVMNIRKGNGPADVQQGQVFVENLHVEEDHFDAPVVPVSPGKSFWYWGILYGGSSETFEIPSPGVAPNGEATLRVHVQGAISGPMLNEHQATVRLNGTLIGTGNWDDLASPVLVFKFPSSYLTESNTVEVVSSGSSGYYLDAFDLSYPRYMTARNDSLLFTVGMDQVMTVDGFSSNGVSVFDVTNPSAPTLIQATRIDPFGGGYRVSFSPTTQAGRYLALNMNTAKAPVWFGGETPSSLRNEENRADYLIIALEVLKPSAEALAAYRSTTLKLQTYIALLEDIYNEFNYGIADPYAIRSFLQHVYMNWRRVPRYVVLLGKGTYDYKDVTQQATNLLPPIMVPTPEGMFASDNRFADVAGDDGIPEYALGRIPVVSNEEFDAYLAKLSASENHGETWRGNVLLTAEARDGKADFKAQAEAMAVLAGSQSVYRIYLDDLPIDIARASLQTDLNVNGMAVMTHVGHGGMDRLATGGLLTISDVQNLTNANQLPFVSALSCLINRFEVPGVDVVLGEALVIAPNGGASAVWAPTGTSVDSDAALLGKKLFEAIYVKGINRAGDAVVEAMRSFRGEVAVKPVMLDVYTLLGDPATRIGRERGDGQIGHDRSDSSSFQRSRQIKRGFLEYE